MPILESLNFDMIALYLQYGSMFIGFILCIFLSVIMMISIDAYNQSNKIIERRYPKKKPKVRFKTPTFDDL